MLKITDQLTQAETALLYSAMLFYKENSESAFAETILNNGSQLHKDFFKYVEQSVKELMQKLFAETHVDEMDFIRHFNQQFTQQQINKKQTGKCSCVTGIKDKCLVHDTFG